MRITLVDYGVGNIHSLAKACTVVGADVFVATTPEECFEGVATVLPGVGAFAPAAKWLAPVRARFVAAAAHGRPVLGICLGMQLLFDESAEGEGEGLGLIPGGVRRLSGARTPQMGWNTIDDTNDPLLDQSALHHMYYANSFVCQPSDPAAVIAWSEHEGDRFAAAVRSSRTVGVQFHPEKSAGPGLSFLRAFFREVAA